MSETLRRRPDESKKEVREFAEYDELGSTPARFSSSSRNENSENSSGTSTMPKFLKVAVIFCTAVVVFLLIRDPGIFLRIFKDSSDATAPGVPNAEEQTGKTIVNGVTLYTKEELAKFNGVHPDQPVLLAYMGKVYDVSKGRRHYGPGGSYQFFSGRDATRSFLTGDFKNDLTDNLDGIADAQYGEIENWENTYSKSADYEEVGVLCGNFYQCVGDKQPGQPTEKLLHAHKMIAKSKLDAAKDNEIFLEFPQCNSEWTQEKGGRVWCSDKSGGVERRWSGVPRLFLSQKDGKKSTRCACVHPDKLRDPRVELYPSCPPDAESCKLQQN